MSTPKLTAKQARFVEEYLIDLCASAAYQRAGYKARGNVAETNACRLLRNAQVQEAIAVKQRALAAKCEVTAERVIRELAGCGFSDPRKLFSADGSMKSIRELDDSTAASISSIETRVELGKGDDAVPERITRVRLWDKNSALEKLCKHLGLFSEDNRQKAEADPVAALLQEIDGRSTRLTLKD
jgi:phage terminase small subunit